jgi:acyl carrier protein
VIPLAALPKTASGKIDRGALPDSWVDRGTRSFTNLSALTPAEQVLHEIFRDLLGLADVGLEEDFLSLGGDSLRALELVAQIERTLHVRLTIREVLSAGSVTRLARSIADALAGPQADQAAPIRPRRSAASPAWTASMTAEEAWSQGATRPDRPVR